MKFSNQFYTHTHKNGVRRKAVIHKKLYPEFIRETVGEAGINTKLARD
jgi:hypothetical protein